MYASMMASDFAQDSIVKIYSFDGPGFRPEFLDSQDYDELKDRMVKIVPKSSPVGLLLNTPGDYMVTEARAFGAMQHNPYTWVLKDNKLSETKVTEQHLLMMKTMNDWILSLDDEGVKNFVDMLCWMVDATQASTTVEFKEEMPAHTLAFIKASQDMDEESKDIVSGFVKSYFELAGEMLKEDVKERIESVKAELLKKKDEVVSEVTKKRDEVMSEVNKMRDDTKSKKHKDK